MTVLENKSSRLKINLRKERDKAHDARTERRTGFHVLSQILLIQGILIMKCTLTSASHLPVTFDLKDVDNNSTSESSPLIVANSVVSTIDRSFPYSSARKEHSFTANCSDDGMTIFGSFPEKFKGRIYASDYSDENECGIVLAQEPSENVTFRLTLGQCGIQMTAIDNILDSNELLHEVNLYIQYSAFLQQMSDERVTVYCLENKNILEGADEKSDSSEGNTKIKTRQGRRMKDSGRNLGLQKTNTRIGEAIMEIIGGKDPSPKSKKTSPVAVGEDVTLVISTKVLRGFDARIVNCTTHDGSRSSTSNDGIRNQPILDSAGCSVDKSLVPNFRRRRLPVESRNRIITLHFASFPVFKFPDRDHLHIQCVVAYCQGPCPQETCDSASNHYGTWRQKYGRIADVLMDVSQVVNSIEVLSPDLDSPGGHHYEKHDSASQNGQEGSHRLSPSSQQLAATLSTSQRPPQTHYSKPGSTYHQYHQYYNNEEVNQLYGGQGSGGHGSRGQIPLASNLTQYNVCISPGTVIISLVVLGLVIVISITVTLWFALKRSEVRKYAESQKSIFSSPGISPSPYYRFNHW